MGGRRCVISVYGIDHPGIVHAVSAALAGDGVNILDLSSRAVGRPPIYTLGIEAELPEGMSVADLEARLRPVADAARVRFAVTTEGDDPL
jgi:glycine cleavage system transcriptional repressor